MAFVIEMLDIDKSFPGIRANDHVTLQVAERSIHALLGENGAGKSTLMSILFGLYQPDAGTIRVRGKDVRVTDPNVANELGIGMVHQHFKLVHNFTVTENIILGLEPRKGLVVDARKAERRVEELSRLYGLNVDPRARIEDISVGMQQRVEILKMLYRDAEILIFDEPTAVLTPQEIHELMGIMRRLVGEGKTVLLITHKLREIKEVADSCTVLRRGRLIGTVPVAETSEEMVNGQWQAVRPTEKRTVATEEERAGQSWFSRIVNSITTLLPGAQPVLLTNPVVRPHLRRLLERALPHLVVLRHSEIPMDIRVVNLGTVA